MRTTSKPASPASRSIASAQPAASSMAKPGARAAVATVRMRMADPLTRSGAGKQA